jgi:hypothetical protein
MPRKREEVNSEEVEALYKNPPKSPKLLKLKHKGKERSFKVMSKQLDKQLEAQCLAKWYDTTLGGL